MPLATIAHQSYKRTRIDACREESANRNVGNEMVTHAIKKRFADNVVIVIGAAWGSFGLLIYG
jgi:hypothetical protein